MIKENLLKILFVEDLPSDVELAVMELRKEGLRFEHIRIETRSELIKAVNEFRPDIIISDYMMPSYTGMQALNDARGLDPLIPFILYTGSMNEETAVECIKAGATDYIIKEHMTRLPFAVKEALDQHNIQIEKRAAELLLKENEEKLQSIFSAAPVGIGLLVNQVFMEINDTFCKMTGYDRKELIGNNAEIIYAKDEQNESAGIVIYRHIAEKGTGSVETRFKCKNGKVLNIFLSSTPLDKDDLTKGVTFIAMDITERKRAEEALRESEERFRILYNEAVVGLYRTNLKGEIFLANRALFKMLGFKSFEELAARNLEETGYGLSYQRQQFIDKIEKDGEVKDLEAIWICRDGKEIFVRESAKAIFDSEGKIIYYDGTVEDITQRKSVEQELIRSKEKAEESDRLKTAFLHNISHEIRTPMNAIVGFSALLGEPDIDTQTQQSYIETIMQSSNHLLSIITDIVDISNIEANLVKIAKNEINVNKTLKAVYNFFISKAMEKKIKMVCETGLSDSDALIITDSTKLTQIISNLISNAIKFTDEGYIKLTYKLKESFLEFCVSDTGIGIAEEYNERIYDRFFQVQNTVSRIYEGTGLGLSISKAYVDQMGGRIWLVSKPGKGTKFYFTTPYVKSVSVVAAPSEIRSSEKLELKTRKTILIAEDIDSNFKLLTYFLSGSNIEILRAENGKEAVEKCLSGNHSHIDLVLMDIKMPAMDGYTAAKLIREANLTIPIIAQTAYADDRSRVIEGGFNGFISKPFDKKTLLKVLTEFM